MFLGDSLEKSQQWGRQAMIHLPWQPSLPLDSHPPISQRVYELKLQIFQKIVLTVIIILAIQSGHTFEHVMTAQLSWHVQNCDLITSTFFKQEQHEFLQDLDNELINLLRNGFQDTTCVKATNPGTPASVTLQIDLIKSWSAKEGRFHQQLTSESVSGKSGKSEWYKWFK